MGLTFDEQQANLTRFPGPRALGPELERPRAARSEGLHLLQLRPGLRSHCDALTRRAALALTPWWRGELTSAGHLLWAKPRSRGRLMATSNLLSNIEMFASLF